MTKVKVAIVNSNLQSEGLVLHVLRSELIFTFQEKISVWRRW